MIKQGMKIAILLTMMAVASTGAAALTNCSVTTTPVAFGVYLGAALTSTGTISTACTGVIPVVNVHFDAGMNAGGSFAARQLISAAGQSLNYNLYTDASHIRIWGDGTTGTYTQQGMNLTVYGQLPGLQNTSPGSYDDTVLVTIIW